jgi:uncharacterized RDD family membrane protein YckC
MSTATPSNPVGYGQNTVNTKMQRTFVTPEGVDLRLELADGSQRVAAFAIDLSIMITTLLAFSLFLGVAGIGSSSVLGVEWVVIVWLLGAFVLRNFYFVAFELAAKASTPGKQMLGLRVAARNGGRLQAQAVLVRNAMRELEFFIPLSVVFTRVEGGGGEGWMYLLAFVWVAIFALFPLFNKDRLRPGDLVAGTWVVRTPKQALLRDIAEDSAREETRAFTFTQEQIQAYGVKELQVLEQVLRTRDDETMNAVTQRICNRIGIPHRWDQDHYAFLSAYYAALRRHLETNLLMGKRRADKHDV